MIAGAPAAAAETEKAGVQIFCLPLNGVTHGVDVGEVQWRINAEQQQTVDLLCLGVLLHVPAGLTGLSMPLYMPGQLLPGPAALSMGSEVLQAEHHSMGRATCAAHIIARHSSAVQKAGRHRLLHI